MAMAENVIKSVPAGAKLNLQGDHRIEGPVGKGAEVNLKGGNLTVAGNVGQGAKINVQGGGLTVSGNVMNGASLTAGGSAPAAPQQAPAAQDAAPEQPPPASRFTAINLGAFTGPGFASQAGVPQAGMQQQPGLNAVHRALQQGDIRSALIIMGTIGDNVNLQSSGRIKMKRNAGNGLVARAVKSIIGRALGEYSNVTAGGGARFDSIGPMTEVRAGQTARIGRIADHGIVEAGKSVRAQAIGDGASVTAGTNIKSTQTSRSAHLEAPKTEAGTRVNHGIIIGNNAKVSGLSLSLNDASGSTKINIGRANNAAIAVGNNATAVSRGGTAIAVGRNATATNLGPASTATSPTARGGGPRGGGSGAKASPPKMGR
jgi:hypothetical protein